jgi:hypothetical protein
LLLRTALAVAFLFVVNKNTNSGLAFAQRAKGQQGNRGTGQQGHSAEARVEIIFWMWSNRKQKH